MLSPLDAGDDGGVRRDIAFSRRKASELPIDLPSLEQGRRECRVKASPMARLQQKKQAAVTTGSAGSTGIPCAMVLTVSFVLSSVTMLFCHRRLAGTGSCKT